MGARRSLLETLTLLTICCRRTSAFQLCEVDFHSFTSQYPRQFPIVSEAPLRSMINCLRYRTKPPAGQTLEIKQSRPLLWKKVRVEGEHLEPGTPEYRKGRIVLCCRCRRSSRLSA